MINKIVLLSNTFRPIIPLGTASAKHLHNLLCSQFLAIAGVKFRTRSHVSLLETTALELHLVLVVLNTSISWYQTASSRRFPNNGAVFVHSSCKKSEFLLALANFTGTIEKVLYKIMEKGVLTMSF